MNKGSNLDQRWNQEEMSKGSNLDQRWNQEEMSKGSNRDQRWNQEEMSKGSNLDQKWNQEEMSKCSNLDHRWNQEEMDKGSQPIRRMTESRVTPLPAKRETFWTHPKNKQTNKKADVVLVTHTTATSWQNDFRWWWFQRWNPDTDTSHLGTSHEEADTQVFLQWTTKHLTFFLFHNT